MSILEFIIFLIIGSIVLPNIYNQIKDIINYQPQAEFELGDLTNDICLGGICLNKCDNLNGQEVKRTGNTALLNQNNIFQATDCGDDKVLRDLRLGGVLCGEEGTDECNAEHCCYPKLCENDLNPLDDDDYNRHYPTPEAKIEKRRRDGNCPYQKTVKKNTPCSGGNPGESGGCTDEGGVCCEPKKCSTHWFSNENPEWGIGTECPHQTGPAADRGNDMLKYPDDTPCDTCDISECCFEQTNFCIVEANDANNPNGVYNHANTNVGNVGFPSGTNLSFPGNDNTSVDLTTNYFLRKTDVSQTNIQNLLSFGSEGGSDTDDHRYGIKCEDGFKYGMCNAIDAGTDDNTCKIHDNNQRECEAAGCSFTLGNRPRVDYSECGDTDGHNIIKVGNCIDTCTADHTLTDGGINYFTQTPLDNGSYRVNPDFYSNKLNTDNDYPYSQGEIPMDCYNHTGIGNSLHYNYNCEGGGSYFSVSQLSNCNTTCRQLHDQGLRCGQGNIYDENKADDVSSYANFRVTEDGGCCMPVTCDTLSNGQSLRCLSHQTRRTDTQTQDSEVSRDSCCVNKTCSNFMNEYNDLPNKSEVVDENNICLDGRTFNANRELTSAYLYQVPHNDNGAKLTRMDEYRSGSADYDIGCCSNLTCGEWLSNLDMPDIPADQKLSEASRMCGDGKFFVENMFAGDMGGTITEDSSCCVGESEITCNPTQELVASESGFTIPGYTFLDNIQFTEKTFNMDTSSGGGEYSINADNISCSTGFRQSDEGIKYKCRINSSTGDGTYYLSGCNSETPDTGETGSVETSDKLCNLPTHLENSIQVNGFSFDAGNNVVNFNHFLGNQDQFSCNESKERPVFTECSEDFTELTISGCHYQDKPTVNEEHFYSDRFFRYNEHVHGEDRTTANSCEILYIEEATDYQYDEYGHVIGPRPDDYRDELIGIADEIYRKDPSLANNLAAALDIMKGNVSNFSCKCPGEGDNECPDHERQVRFKYIFANDEDFYNGDNDFISNHDAIVAGNTYSLEQILRGGSRTVCEPGYYPYRGTKYDYCRPCDDRYKNNHPISAIAKNFCDSGHMGDSDIVTNLLDIQHNIDSMNSNYESNSSDISTLRAVRTFADGVANTNEDYSPYFGADLSPPIISGSSDINSIDINSINFMTADNFTLGTRVCDPEPNSGTACSPKVKIYGDYDQPATEGSQFDKAKKWWRTYFNNNFNIDGANTDNSDILDISSAPSETTIPDNKPTLKSRINDSGTLLQPPSEFTINDITDLKKEHYLYRNNLEIHTPADTTPIPISTVCNNNTSGVDYIPSFNPVNSNEGSNEGECKACVNEMPPGDGREQQIPDGDAPFNSPGDYIVRNIDNVNNAPICSYEANMYNESYNEGNIVGFKSKTTGVIHHEAEASAPPAESDGLSEWNRGPCNEGFIYQQDGYNLVNVPRSNPGAGDASASRGWVAYVKCMPENKIITKFCENITEEDICNKSFSTGLSYGEQGILSNQLEGELDTDEQILDTDEQKQMINNSHVNGFCGWNNSENKCKNIYDTENGYLSHKYLTDGPSFVDEDYSNHNSLYIQQSVMDYLSPHITSYTTSRDYDYSNLYGNSAVIAWQNTQQEAVTPYQEHETHDVNTGNIKGANDAVFNISNYGVGKGGVSASGSDDLTNLSIANALKEGYDSIRPSLHDSHNISYLSTGSIDLNSQPLRPTRINPANTALNDTMINRCHPILWDGPVDFFYENNHSTGANDETTPKTTISSSCYLRDGSTTHTHYGADHILPAVSGDYSIKSTPLYYNKGRGLQGGTLTNLIYHDDDYTHNILNPGTGLDGIMYAENQQNMQYIAPNDSGFTDAAIFPLIDRVRGCFNDSLIYGSQSRPTNSSLGLDAANIDNEREQCIFHWNHSQGSVVNSDAAKGCVNACLNNNECDLVRISKDAGQTRTTRCELLKWNKLPDNIVESRTILNPGRSPITFNNGIRSVAEDGGNGSKTGMSAGHIRDYNLGGHLINANEEYDQSTRQGVVNWYNRITAPRATEMNHEVTLSDDGPYRTEFYSWKSQNPNYNIRDWRTDHLMGSGSSGDTIQIKGRPLWKTSTDDSGSLIDNEIWISMNKIRAPTPDGKITDILNHINNYELPDGGIQPIDSGGNEWRAIAHGVSGVDQDTYYTNDSSTTYPNKYNEKTVIDSANNHKQCPPGTYVQDNNGVIDGGYKCSQVINQCASCQDIHNYHTNKGDFEGMNGVGQELNFMRSYGCVDWSNSNGYPWIRVQTDRYGDSQTLDKILDAIGSENKINETGAQFNNQHNLMAKTPDGNIIDAEKCMCRGTVQGNGWLARCLMI